ncbi:tyrosine-protein phosphatase non-receptor type 23-like [Xenia sp. Carnegie-2017]|uniref:tyrosine-protein phosphatase non-receptor type 23-like n=1 Tax=Xenia sp. Carnegie-2017 TaxID=2897299 RepID=UPI001F044978|nr:tyrosine-protein phosphatase non-receptor type 23-like [Xenia sp. Carnegie-2017]
MEGCPRSLMLKLELKESSITSFAPTLKQYIKDFYHEDGETYTQECTQLEQLRTAVIKPTYDNSGCNLLRRYYGQIHLLKTRFPMCHGSPACVEFTWTDLYTDDPVSMSDISFEQTSILFNLGALHSLLGSREDRISEEGMKVACTHYQSAAGVFTYLMENFTTDQYSDTAKDLLSLYINVMLGQAQECLLEKSMLDNRKNSLVARIAMQVQNYYTEAIACLASSFGEILPPKVHKLWSKLLQIKCSYLNALAYMYMSNASDEQSKYGEKVAFLKIAAQRISEAKKLLKNQSKQMQDVVQFITDVITQKLEGAKRDNDFIYHEAEPASTALPEIKGASLVKPIPFQPYDPSTGKDIFEKLIPMKAHESSSLYSEEKANLLRRYGSIVSEKDKELSSWLASMHIDDLMSPEESDSLPDDLKKKCEVLQANPGDIKKSMEMLTKLKGKSTEFGKVLEDTRQEILDVQNERKGLIENEKVKIGDDKLKECLDEVNGYYQRHMDATKTNEELGKAFEANRRNLELMIGPEEALLGILPTHNILDSPIEGDTVQRIRDLLGKIDKMKTQRVQFMEKLREEVNKDDITHLIATKEGEDLQSLFKEELKKHDESCDLLKRNLDAQEKIMNALTDANAKYASARKSVAEIKANRDAKIKNLMASYDSFISFKEKVRGGLDFYGQMSEMIEKRRPILSTVCQGEKDRLRKIVGKAGQLKNERGMKSQDGTPSSNVMFVDRKSKPAHLSQPRNPQSNPPNLPGNMQYSHINPNVMPAGPRPNLIAQPQIPGVSNQVLGNPQFSSGNLHNPSGGYKPPAGHVPLSHHSIPHSLRGPLPNQHPPISSHAQINSSIRGATEMSQPLVPRVSSGTLLTTRPIMSYPFPATSYEGTYPRTSTPFQPTSRSDIPNQLLVNILPFDPNVRPLLGVPPLRYPGPRHEQILPPSPRGIVSEQPMIPQQHMISQFQPGQQSFQQQPEISLQHWQPKYTPLRPESIPSGTIQQPSVKPPSYHEQFNIASNQPPPLVPQPNTRLQLSPGPNVKPQSNPGTQSNLGVGSFVSNMIEQQYALPNQKNLSQPRAQEAIPFDQSRTHSLQSQYRQPFRPTLPSSTMQQSQLQVSLNRPPLPQASNNQHHSGHHHEAPLQPFSVQPNAGTSPQQYAAPGSSFHPRPRYPAAPLQPQPSTQFHFQQQPVGQYHQLGPYQQQSPYHGQTVFKQENQSLGPASKAPLDQPAVIESPIYSRQPLEARSSSERLPTQQYQSSQVRLIESNNMEGKMQYPISSPFDNPTSSFSPSPNNEMENFALAQTNKISNSEFRNVETGQYPSTGNLGQSNSPFYLARPASSTKSDISLSTYPLPTSSSNLEHQVNQPNKDVFFSQVPSSTYFQPDHDVINSAQSNTSTVQNNSRMSSTSSHPSSANTSKQYYSSGNIPNHENVGKSAKNVLTRPGPLSVPVDSAGTGTSNSKEDKHSEQKAIFGLTDKMASEINRHDYKESDQMPDATKEDFSVNDNQSMVSINDKLLENLNSFGSPGQLNKDGTTMSLFKKDGIAESSSSSSSVILSRDKEFSVTSNTKSNFENVTNSVTKPTSEEQPSNPGNNDNSGLVNSGVSGQRSSSMSSQEDLQSLQHKVLLQQQQLIDQQQRFLQQQVVGEQSQVWRLMEQVKHQQKELEDLRNEIKVKEQSENFEKKQNVTADVERNESSQVAIDEDRLKDETSDITQNHVNSNASHLKLVASTNQNENIEFPKEENVITENDFKVSQLNEISSSSAYHEVTNLVEKPSKVSGLELISELTVAPRIEDSSSNSSQTAQMKPDFLSTEPSEPFTMKSLLQSKTTIGNKESDVKKEVDVVVPEDTIKESSTVFKKRRPPPSVPEAEAPSQLEVVTADVFSQARIDTGNAVCSTAQEGTVDASFVLRLQGLVEDYRDIVNNLPKKPITGHSNLTKEWLDLQHHQDTISKVLTCDVGKANATKNRYLDILPYDQTRVILQGKEDSDYINATLIEDLTPLSPKYIASQGPIPQCFMDFWLMVWQEKCPLIVMLTKEVEGKKLKCHQYWPKDEGHSMLFGSLRVTMKRQVSLPLWRERVIHVTHDETDEVHIVEHYQFMGWPDHGVPSNPSDFFTFMEHIYNRQERNYSQVKFSMLLHCSAGVGRTGAFIVIYSAMRELYSGNGIMDVSALVKKLRTKRKYMVQRKEQYEFCYKAILYSAEQFLIHERKGDSAGDSSVSSTSSDEISSSDDDDDEKYCPPPIVPQRPQHTSNSKTEINSTKMHDDELSKTFDFKSGKQSQKEPEVKSILASKITPGSLPGGVSGNDVDQIKKMAENQNGGGLNNFLEICTESLRPIDTAKLENINDSCLSQPKDSLNKPPHSELQSNDESDLGETKYKEITQDPDENDKRGPTRS